MPKARKHVMAEASISHIIKQLRVLTAAVRETKTAPEWRALLRENEVMAYSELDSEIYSDPDRSDLSKRNDQSDRQRLP